MKIESLHHHFEFIFPWSLQSSVVGFHDAQPREENFRQTKQENTFAQFISCLKIFEIYCPVLFPWFLFFIMLRGKSVLFCHRVTLTLDFLWRELYVSKIVFPNMLLIQFGILRSLHPSLVACLILEIRVMWILGIVVILHIVETGYLIFLKINRYLLISSKVNL